MIRLGTSADLAAATGVYRRASLSNAGDRGNLLAHPGYLILGPEGLAEGRTHVAEEDGSLVGFATWIETAGAIELEDLFVDPGYMRRGIAAALINRIVDVLRARGVERLEVTANPHALGFYRAVGFIDCGVAETEFGAAPRMELAISLLRRHFRSRCRNAGNLTDRPITSISTMSAYFPRFGSRSKERRAHPADRHPISDIDAPSGTTGCWRCAGRPACAAVSTA